MPTVHVMTGLPASGKSTVARQLVRSGQGRTRRVNLDDLRAMLDTPSGGEKAVWSREHEQTALAIQDAAVRAAIDGGFDLVVDNTHLTQHIPRRLKAAVAGRALFKVLDLTAVPLEECIRRDAARGAAGGRSVGEDVIRKLAAQHGKATRGGWRLTDAWMNDTPPVTPYVPDTTLPMATLCDIDGTLALNEGTRGPYDFTRCGEDTLNTPVRMALLAFRTTHRERIILLSGRGEEHRPQTEAWLTRHNVPHDELWMRPAGDNRRDDIVKAELFDTHVRHRFNILRSLDDRDRVVDLWRRMGIPTWQVNYGAF